MARASTELGHFTTRVFTRVANIDRNVFNVPV